MLNLIAKDFKTNTQSSQLSVSKINCLISSIAMAINKFAAEFDKNWIID